MRINLNSFIMESNQSLRGFAYLFVLMGFISIFFILDMVFGLEYNVHELREKAYAEEATSLEKKSDDVISESDKLDREEDTTENEAGTESLNMSDFFGLLLNEYQSNVVMKLEEGKARTDLIIRYYRHAPDENSAYALEELGYYIHERPVNPRYANFQSNAIYYGDSVSLKDIQIVGYTLLQEGLPIKVIKPSKFGESWKSRSIEIGTDTTLVNKPSITLETLKSLKL